MFYVLCFGNFGSHGLLAGNNAIPVLAKANKKHEAANLPVGRANLNPTVLVCWKTMSSYYNKGTHIQYRGHTTIHKFTCLCVLVEDCHPLTL